jgi:membrane protein implicated in regulation of membrane protease activity
MAMDGLLDILGGWTWWIVAGLLLLAELASPGIFFIWLAFAAATMGVIVFFVTLGWQMQLALWALLSIAYVVIAKPWLKRRNAVTSDQPNLNRRMLNYIGNTYVLDEPIVDGWGKIRIEDTLWQVTGPDGPKGQRVKVLRVEGLSFVVEPVAVT